MKTTKEESWEKGKEKGQEEGEQMGTEKGLVQGREEGKQIGVEKGIKTAALGLFKAGFLNDNQIAEALNISLEQVLQYKNES